MRPLSDPGSSRTVPLRDRGQDTERASSSQPVDTLVVNASSPFAFPNEMRNASEAVFAIFRLSVRNRLSPNLFETSVVLDGTSAPRLLWVFYPKL